MKKDVLMMLVWGFIYNFFFGFSLTNYLIINNWNVYLFFFMINSFIVSFLLVLLKMINPDIEDLIERLKK